MKNYEKPVVLANSEMSEGVYAASGNCWTVDVSSVQPWNGAYHVFEVKCVHTNAVEHISEAITVSVTFSAPIAEYSYAEYESSVSGSTITVTRTSLADAYNNGDLVTFKIWASTGDEATTKALSAAGSTISCSKAINVQGGGADEL